MLQFRDFVPRQLKPQGFLSEGEYDTFESAASAAGHWAKSKGVRIVNVETVVLPNLWSSFEKGSTDAELAGHMTRWYQFVRLWYEA